MNVVELVHVTPDLTGLHIAVLAPAAGPTRLQLRAMMALARQAGHHVTWYEPRLGGASVARTVRALAVELSSVERLIVGDPFSGVIQVIISISRNAEVTIVDDGTATLEFARQWVAGEQLSRWHRLATPSQRRQIATLARDQIAGNVRRRLSPEHGGRLRLFTCMPVDLPGVEVIRNDFSWVRDAVSDPGDPVDGRSGRHVAGRVRSGSGRALPRRGRIPAGVAIRPRATSPTARRPNGSST